MILWIDGRNILHRRVIFDNVIEGVEGHLVLLLLGVELDAVVAELVAPEDLVGEVGGADLHSAGTLQCTAVNDLDK